MFPLFTFPFFSHLFCFLAVRDGAGGIPAGLQREVIVSLDQGQIVTCAQVRLQEERGAHTAQLPMGYDSNSIAQDVSFIHVMSRQDDGSA